MLAGPADQFHDIAVELLIDADRPHDLLALYDLVGGDHCLEVVNRMPELKAPAAWEEVIVTTDGLTRFTTRTIVSDCATPTC